MGEIKLSELGSTWELVKNEDADAFASFATDGVGPRSPSRTSTEGRDYLSLPSDSDDEDDTFPIDEADPCDESCAEARESTGAHDGLVFPNSRGLETQTSENAIYDESGNREVMAAGIGAETPRFIKHNDTTRLSPVEARFHAEFSLEIGPLAAGGLAEIKAKDEALLEEMIKKFEPRTTAPKCAAVAAPTYCQQPLEYLKANDEALLQEMIKRFEPRARAPKRAPLAAPTYCQPPLHRLKTLSQFQPVLQLASVC